MLFFLHTGSEYESSFQSQVGSQTVMRLNKRESTVLSIGKETTQVVVVQIAIQIPDFFQFQLFFFIRGLGDL